jgi:PAS domain S-box-containing protein
MNITSLTNKLKIRNKLILFVLFPLTMLIVFSSINISSKIKDQYGARENYKYILMVINIEKLIHALQNERGIGYGYHQSTGAIYKEEILEKRLNADKAIQSYLQMYKNTLSEYKGFYLISFLEDLKVSLDGIGELRNAVDNFQADYSFDNYSRIIERALGIIQGLQGSSSSSESTNQASIYYSLLMIKEYSGQERGILNGVFAVKFLSSIDFKKIIAAISVQKVMESKIIATGDEQTANDLILLKNNKAVREFEKIRSIVEGKVNKNELLNIVQMSIGYGGLIHSFKNFTIRGDKKYYIDFVEAFESTILAIERYELLKNMSSEEMKNLTTIKNTVMEYKDNIEIVQFMKSEKRSVNQIDKAVKVNGRPALMAIERLSAIDVNIDPALWWKLATKRIEMLTSIIKFNEAKLIGRINEELRSNTNSLILYIVGSASTLLITFLIGGLLIGRLSKEITGIADSLNEMRESDNYLKVLEVVGEDEIAEVAKSFNAMNATRLKAEDKLRMLSLAVEQSSNSIVITGLDGRIQYVNQAFSEFTGYGKEELIGKTPRVLKSGNYSDRFYKKMWDTLIAGSIWKGEICNKNKKGELYWEYQMISPIKNHKGDISHYLAVKIDDTERRNAEQKIRQYSNELRHRNDELQQFVSIASHDLKEPLRKVISFGGRLIGRSADLDEKSHEYINRMQKSSERMLVLIDDLLDLSKVTTKTKPFVLQNLT